MTHVNMETCYTLSLAWNVPSTLLGVRVVRLFDRLRQLRWQGEASREKSLALARRCDRRTTRAYGNREGAGFGRTSLWHSGERPERRKARRQTRPHARCL